MRRRSPHGWAAAAGLLVMGLASPALAISSTQARGRAQLAVQAVEGGMGSVKAAAAKAKRREVTPAQRIAAGDILLRNKDYDRAIHVFSQVVELRRQGKVSEATNADALFLLGESYFQDKQFLSGRRHYREIIEKASQNPYDSYAGRALSRLVDIALRTNNFADLDYVLARINQLPASDASGSLQYARGKAYFAKGDYSMARSALGTVSISSDFGLQAQYILGVILVKEAAPPPPPAPDVTSATDDDPAKKLEEAQQPATPPPVATPAQARARYASAIEQFRKVTKMAVTRENQRHVIDLAWMAMGRLFYETDNYLDAAEAYSHVDRKSPEFSTMLYELAWVYVRLGDYQRAQRALEVLSITDPESLQLADGSLLRADLMLRSGQYEKALTLYRTVRSRFDPIREQVDRFLSTTQDPAIYYDKLVQDRLESDSKSEELPPIVIEWARELAEDDRVFAMIDDVSRSRDLIKKSRRLAQKLSAVLGSPTRAKAFPELKASLEATLGLLNKLALARKTLAEGMDDVGSSNPGGELGKVRAERRVLMRRMSYLPVTDGDFANREASGERQWNKLSQQLQRLQLEADRLQAIINGLKRVLKDGDQFGVVRDPGSRQRFQQEIAANERDLEAYKKRITDYRDLVDMGKAQIGFGDQRYVEDDQVRRRFRQVFAREVQLVSAGQDNGSAASYARSIQPILTRADRAESQLEAVKTKLEQQAAEQAEGLRKKVAEEAVLIETYASNLDDLDQQARVLVGEVAMKNFGLVRDRLKSIVLRADVGIVQQAWEVREEQRIRVNNLQRERSREEQKLNDELREVLDDAEGSE